MKRTIVAVTAAIAVAGCTGQTTPTAHTPSATYTAPPLPSGATAAPAPESTAPQPVCDDPTRSLRPLPDTGESPGPTVDAIRARGRLIVGLDTGSNLFSFRDPVTGTLSGFDVDIAREIARDLFGDPERIEFRNLSSAQRISALQEHTVDVVVKTMTITCERAEQVDFSAVYFLANQRILAVKGSGIGSVADLAGKRVCIVDGTTSLHQLAAEQPAATILTVSSWADCLVVLQQRQVDAISTDDAILAGLAAQDPYLEIVGDSISAEPYGIGIARGSEDLVRFVNRTLERIRLDGTWNQVYNTWLSVLGRSPGAPLARYED